MKGYNIPKHYEVPGEQWAKTQEVGTRDKLCAYNENNDFFTEIGKNSS